MDNKRELAEHYTELVIRWLREIALNNFENERYYRFVDVVEDIRERAIFGLKNYIIDTENEIEKKKNEADKYRRHRSLWELENYNWDNEIKNG